MIVSFAKIMVTTFCLAQSLAFYFLMSMINSDIIDGNKFAFLQVVLGLVFSSIFIYAFFLIQTKIIDKSSNSISISAEERLKKENKEVFLFVFGVIICMSFASFLLLNVNEKYNKGLLKSETYIILSHGELRSKGTKQDYVVIKNLNSNENRRFYINKVENYKKGTELKFETRIGFLGFNYIDEIK